MSISNNSVVAGVAASLIGVGVITGLSAEADKSLLAEADRIEYCAGFVDVVPDCGQFVLKITGIAPPTNDYGSEQRYKREVSDKVSETRENADDDSLAKTMGVAWVILCLGATVYSQTEKGQKMLDRMWDTLLQSKDDKKSSDD